jgi:carboxypeptidase Q
MEAIRILTALHKPMDRTVRIALWGREEEGLLGSKFYVQQYFAPRDTMKQTPEFAKLDAYFDDDSGSGRFRGISANGNLLTKAIFEQWIAPVKDLSRSPRSSEPPPRRPASLSGQASPPSVGSASTDTVSCRIRWSTPAYPPLQYGSLRPVQVRDVIQGAALEAWFVYNTATRPEMLPRNPGPTPTAK